MAFPVVQGRATGRTTATDTTTHAITLPAGIVAGELLVVVFSVDGAPTCTATGWTKLGQATNGTTVTSAVFWKAAAGSDTCTVTTSAAEQSSHASFRISGAQLLEGISANGSSTNSDPPNLAPLGSSQEYLWIATRAGDSTIVATAAPSGFGNFQTLAAAGTGGASVNAAELAEVATAKNPGVFTSKNEQWVAWTLAAYTWSVTQDFTADHVTVYTYAQNDLAAGFAVDGGLLSANPWFSRLTDGYETWAAYGAPTAEADFAAFYNTVAAVEATLAASYNAGEATTGYDPTWFPLLTDGANTWAGVTVAETTGVINGVADLPLLAQADYSALYSASAEVTADRLAFYTVTSAVTQDFTGEYSADGSVDNTFVALFDVATPVIVDFAGAYAVLGIVGSVQQDAAFLYRILASAAQSYTATYQVNPTSQVETTFSARFNVVNSVYQDFGPQYWSVVEPVYQDYSAAFDTLNFAQDDLAVLYQVVTAPEADFSAEYTVGIIPLGEEVDVYGYRETEVFR